MRLHARAFGMAAGIVAAVLFTLCGLAVAVAPDQTTAFAGYLMHMDLSGMPRTLTFASFLGGLITWTLSTAIVFWAVAAVYNQLFERVGVAGPIAAVRPAAHGAAF